MTTAAPLKPQKRVIASQVEPRIVDRRRTVELVARRKRHRIQIASGLVILLVAAVVGLALSPLFAVQKVTILGRNGIEEAALVSGSGISMGDHLVAVDLAAARDALMDMPWVASAHVERKWPHTVVFNITEQKPAALLQSADSLVLVSSTGRILQSEPEAAPGQLLLKLDGAILLARNESTGPSSLPADQGLVGKTVSSDVSQAVGVLERMPDSLRSEVAGARLSKAGALSLELTDGTQVLFGPPEDISAKLLAVESVLNQVVRECMKTLDVREPTRAAVSRGPGCVGISPPSSSTKKTSQSGSQSGSQTGSQSGSQSGSQTGSQSGSQTGSSEGSSSGRN
ncbi:MAG: FtsQ-type POTRA domain-containing protein [Actinobacteria bacterium]|uniref:Unannotated protein n=1 Tax=freshwater metagenome TaxID=449393 RepID=A0A6J6UZD8_9ZZZZ|nr:FtsQ-type POTRA domain-containing protein [Actinomycetota bacterium]